MLGAVGVGRWRGEWVRAVSGGGGVVFGFVGAIWVGVGGVVCGDDLVRCGVWAV